MNGIEKELSALLYNFWITKDDNPELYYSIKYNQDKIKDFVYKNLGSNLIIHDKFVKLEKVVPYIKNNMGIFNSIKEYIILIIILLYLEDKTRGEKFILSDLLEYIKTTSIALELSNIPDWDKIVDRRYLVNVIDFLTNINAIKVRDKSKENFIDTISAEALFESTGLSNYIMRLFDNGIDGLNTYDEFARSEFIKQDDSKGDVRRYNVMRSILYTPAVIHSSLAQSEIDYIKKNRFYIKNELSKYLDTEVEITNNMTLLYDDINSNHKDNYPNTKRITEITLLINNYILKDIKNGIISLNNEEVIFVHKSYFENLIRVLREEKEKFIGKTMMSMPFDKFYKEIIKYMEDYNFIETKDDNIYIYPTISRMIGKTEDISEKNEKQISLFGGYDEL